MNSLFHRVIHKYKNEGILQVLQSTLGFGWRQISLPIFLILYLISKIIPKKDTIHVFGYGDKNSFTDNSKFMFLYIHNCVEGITPVWITKNNDLAQELRSNGFHGYTFWSIRGIYYSLRSTLAFVTHTRRDIPWWWTGGATIVRLGHGVPFKKYHWSNESELKGRPIKKVLNKFIFWNYDYSIATSSEYVPKVVEATNLDPERVFVTGLPRMDMFYRNYPGLEIGVNKKLISKINSINGTTLFYFPTWRESGQNIRSIVTDDVCDKLKQQNIHLFIIPHRNTTFESIDGDNVYLVQKSMDFYPILEEIDVFMTDYSSLFYDSLYNSTPIIFYPYDITEYLDERDLFFEYSNVPGHIAATEEELIQILSNTTIATPDNEKYWLRSTFEYIDGKNAQRVFSEIYERVNYQQND
ncbi:CDP-glycerol glycerophosphotransferase family protein [Halorubrum rubrum]|uniref:CDP-glycerol glycerophosphotransferase family protein n=1 Tax=Halorubrum rubrum TaxID=1126240 RepID=A0ABD5R479_9EURY|nr:CDP-glycerol glycerophosphotransferase family protein [Halorubrum rubrum]